MATTEKQLILVAIKGNIAKQIFGPAVAKVIAWKKSELQRSGNWRGWKLKLRSPQGFKAIPFWEKKTELTYEQKVERIKL